MHLKMTYEKIMPKAFVILAFMVAISTLLHFYGLIDPSVRVGYPWQRHLFWVIFNIIGIYFLLNRRWYLVPIITVLMVQQWYGHGNELVSIWISENRVSVTDIFPMVNTLLIFLAYSYDVYRSRFA